MLAACALALAAADARALSLGDPEVRSGLGEPLDLRFPVTLAKGEFVEPSCFKLAPEGDASAPRVAAGSVSLERSASGTFLRLRTGSPISDSTVAVGLVATCKGVPEEYRREFTIGIEARKATGSSPTIVPAPSAAAESPSITFEPSSILPAIATLIARIGDTLESIAKAIFPDNGNARRSYIDALREANPPLAPLADNDPIPIDTPVALPDLRTFAKARHVAPPAKVAASAPPPPKEEAAAAAPAPPLEEAPPKPAAPAKKSKARPRIESSAPPVAREVPATRPSSAPRVAKAPAPRTQSSGDFVLKLSASTMDMTASRGVDDRTRAKLRERLMVLDADDQVSALLSLRQNVKELETQVADLRLKLSGIPSSFPAPKAAPEPPKVEPPRIVAPPPKVEAPPPKPEPPKVVAPPPKVEAPPPAPEPPKVVAPAPTVEAPPAKVEAPAPKAEAPAPKVETPPAKAEPAPARSDSQPTEWLDYALWALAGLFIIIAVWLAMRLRRRNRDDGFEDTPDLRTATATTEMQEEDPLDAEDYQIVVAEELPVDLEVAPDIPPAAAVAEAPRREIPADVDLPTHIPTNADDLRRRYIEERFPEIGKGAINLDDADSVVKGARLFYEDGALARAIELLQYAIERKPAELKSWLALFEIFRLERLPGEFAELAGRFREHHGKGDYWPKVQYFGREIDPGNELYREAPINSFETIGPAQARRIAAAANVDPVTENWLGAPMDFENEVLANDLRRTLMSDAGIGEQDLIANPMPALRNIEMFNLA